MRLALGRRDDGRTAFGCGGNQGLSDPRFPEADAEVGPLGSLEDFEGVGVGPAGLRVSR